MATKKKLLQAAAGQAGGEALNVEDVFSTYLYTGNGSTQTITNGIDLAGEGGLVWIKNRIAAYHHHWYDTERGIYNYLQSSSSAAQINETDTLTAFNSDGFSLSSDIDVNRSVQGFASWTFRKAPKFFDVVTYTGNGTAGRTVSHNLGSVPGCIIVKRTSSSDAWRVYHRSTGNLEVGRLDATDAFLTNVPNYWNSTTPTSTEFTLGTDSGVNASGQTYVAYLFAHNDGDGEFGPDGDQDIIKCGSYSGDSTTDGSHEIDLGFEPQWVLIKQSNGSDLWFILDTMRGMTDSSGSGLYPHSSAGEDTNASVFKIQPTPTGFRFFENSGFFNLSGEEYIYIAIRRGPMAVPTDATDVFAIDTANSTGNAPPWMYSGWPVDLGMHTNKTGYSTNARVVPRLTSPNYLYTSSTSAEISADTSNKFDYMDGYNSGTYTSTDFISWMWRRAPSFFDVVAYTGVGGDMTLDHNLGVAPDMMWVKKRSGTGTWYVYDSINGHNKNMELNTTVATTGSGVWANTAPTDTQFTVSGLMTSSGGDYIAYLFASLDGVSKVGSFSHTSGTATDVDCGFSSGARFILVKRYSAGGDWMVWDTERGIVAGDDPYLELNNTNAEITGDDLVDPLSSGFTFTGGNADGTYIFYAIA